MKQKIGYRLLVDGLDESFHCCECIGDDQDHLFLPNSVILPHFRCEDICWIQTNHKKAGMKKVLDSNSVFQRTKEHCLMGTKR